MFFLSSPSSRGLNKPLLMPAMSGGTIPTLLSNERGKMKTKFVRNDTKHPKRGEKNKNIFA